MMKTIRNLTFVGLLATVHLIGVQNLGLGGTIIAVAEASTVAPAVSGAACIAEHTYTDSTGRHFHGECDDCGTETWYAAIESCNSNEIMIEYFCHEWLNLVEYICHTPVFD